MKQIAFFCAAALLTAALCACSSSEGNGITTDAVTPAVPADMQQTETADTRDMHGIPVDTLDFGGKPYRAMTYDGSNFSYYFFADEETGDVMNDAIYERRRNVEEALNVTLQHELKPIYTDVAKSLRTAVQANDDAYDQVLLHCIDGVSTSASAGYLYNLDELPYLNMDADWWNREQTDALRLGKNTFFAVNDYMIPYPFIIYFNREIVETLDLTDPYEAVQAGTWTLDVFAEMAKASVYDLNGDGTIDYLNDRMGISATDTSKYISFLPASEQFITGRDSDGRIRLAMNTEKTQHVIEVFHDLNTQRVCHIASTNNDPQMQMETGRILFYMNGPDELERLRDCEVEFGFVPYPKWDETQKEYRSMDFGGLMCVPTTIGDPEMVGAVMELLAWDSENNVVPTYYNTLLEGKFAQDETAASMLRLIFDSICYEVGGNYFGFSGGFNNLFYAVSNVAFRNNSSDFASFYAKNEKSANKTIETFYEALDAAENN